MFFRKLFDVMKEEGKISFAFTKEGENFTVVVQVKTVSKDPALKGRGPLIVTASPEEFEEKFFDTFGQHIKKVIGIVSNCEAFEKEWEEAEKETKAAKHKADYTQKLLKDAAAQEKDGKKKAALELYKKVLQIDLSNQAVMKKIRELEGQQMQSSFFEQPQPEKKEPPAEKTAPAPVQSAPETAPSPAGSLFDQKPAEEKEEIPQETPTKEAPAVETASPQPKANAFASLFN